jgi:hypothetical protein
MTTGTNLRLGQADGDRGRRLGGEARTRNLSCRPVDDSGRSHAQYWAQKGWFNLVQQYGRAGAGRIMAQRGTAAFMKERREYSRYLGEMRELAREER